MNADYHPAEIRGDFRHVEAGDVITRLMAETVEMRLRVTAVDEDHGLIVCGDAESPEYREAWTFDRATGVEVDTDLGWGPQYGRSGSRIIAVEKGKR